MSTTDEVMSLADLYYHNPYREGSHTHLVYADQKRAALLKAVEALAADAERYQFLATSGKQVRCRSKGRKTWYAVINPLTNYEYDYEATLDAAIGAAMQEKTP